MEPSLLLSFVAFFAMVVTWLAAPAANLPSTAPKPDAAPMAVGEAHA